MEECHLLARFLKLFGISSGAFTSNSSSDDRPGEAGTVDAEEIPAEGFREITPEEPLTRFVTDRGHLRPEANHVHWRAFRPKPTEEELSIARISDLRPDAVWQLGDSLAGQPSGRNVVGRADFDHQQVDKAVAASTQLRVIRDEPPERHAVILGWPPRNEPARKTMAMVLAAEASQVIK